MAGCIGSGADDPLGETESSLTSGPDLIESAVGNPPSTGVPGATFSMTDTVTNQGTLDATSSYTKYYLSTDGTTLQFLLGNRAVGAIAAGASDSGMAMVTVPSGTHGTYFVVACADSGPGTGGRTSQVAETNENNNCTASSGTIVITAPDLTETNVSTSPASVDVLFGTLTVSDTVHNGGDAAAGTSVTRWYLSANNVFDNTDAFIRSCNNGPIPGRNVGALAVGMDDAGSASTTPLCIRDSTGLHSPAVGTYWVVACADQTNVVLESNETNNCTVSSNSVLVTKCGNGVIEGSEQCDDGNTVSGDGCSSTCQTEAPTDLTETAVSNPPSSVSTGGTISITDTTANIGTVTAPASQTYYWLSADRTYSTNDRLLTGSRSVPSLAGGTSSSGTATPTVPAGTPAGPWYILACADGPNAIAESNETNNCIASTTTTTVVGPDLVESAVGNPPATGATGGTFSITDTVTNIGAGAAPSSYTKFYLSPNGTSLSYYLGVRSVAALNPGASDAGTTTVTILAGTPNGSYKVIACADSGPGTSGRTSQVPETNENNNCTASTGSIQVGSPDLVITAISNPPTTGTRGTTFTVTDTTANTGAGAAGPFYNKYYLSANGSSIVYYLGTSTQSAGLAAGSSTTMSGTATVGSTVVNGTYFIIGCADAGPGTGGRTSQVPETNENNNCKTSTGTIQIQ